MLLKFVLLAGAIAKGAAGSSAFITELERSFHVFKNAEWKDVDVFCFGEQHDNRHELESPHEALQLKFIAGLAQRYANSHKRHVVFVEGGEHEYFLGCLRWKRLGFDCALWDDAKLHARLAPKYQDCLSNERAARRAAINDELRECREQLAAVLQQIQNHQPPPDAGVVYQSQMAGAYLFCELVNAKNARMNAEYRECMGLDALVEERNDAMIGALKQHSGTSSGLKRFVIAGMQHFVLSETAAPPELWQYADVDNVTKLRAYLNTEKYAILIPQKADFKLEECRRIEDVRRS